MDIHKKLKNNKKVRYLTFFSIIACIAINVILSVNMSSSGLEMAKLEKDIASVKQTEKALRYQLISNTSLLKMEDYAVSNGFTKPPEVVYVKDELNGLAKLP